MFKDILNDFLMNEPTSVIENLENDWDESSVNERLNYTSPIPLNYEQQKIIKALSKKDCKYVVVEGPPGTGKSHTISAIAFNYILENKSILILSDTNYALDVVEDKINDTLNKARHTHDFQNPILRLGKKGNTYGKILSNQSVGGNKKGKITVKNVNDIIGSENILTNSLNICNKELESW